MTNVGTRLQQARLQKGIPLGEVSARTKIREALLVAIERGDFEKLPRGLLARGFIRAYAREVSLDPELVVRQFVEEFEPASPVPRPTFSEESVDAEQRQSRRHRRRDLLWGVILVIGVTTLVAFLGDFSTVPVRSRSTSGTTAGREGGRYATDIALEALDLETRSDSSAEIAAAVDDALPLTIEITPTGVVWVQATADGERVLYDLLDPDQGRVIGAQQEVVLRVGNAEAFQYTVNGVRGRPIGGPGVVRDIRINRDNYTAFQDR